MPVTFPCVRCGKNVKAPDAARGRKIKCPACKKRQPVPKDSAKVNDTPAGAYPPAEPPPAKPIVEHEASAAVVVQSTRTETNEVLPALSTSADFVGRCNRMRRQVVIVRSLATVLVGGLAGFALIAVFEQRLMSLLMILLAIATASAAAWLLGTMQQTLDEMMSHVDEDFADAASPGEAKTNARTARAADPTTPTSDTTT